MSRPTRWCRAYELYLGSFIPGAEQGQLYKYLIETNEGEKLYKADP